MKNNDSFYSVITIIALIWVAIIYFPKEGSFTFSIPSPYISMDNFLRKLFPEPAPLTEAEKVAVEEEIERNTEVTYGKNYVRVEYTKWLWESPQENFGIFHSQNHVEKRGDYDTENSETGIGISFNFTSKESNDSDWEIFVGQGKFIPKKECACPKENYVPWPRYSRKIKTEWKSWDAM